MPLRSRQSKGSSGSSDVLVQTVNVLAVVLANVLGSSIQRNKPKLAWDAHKRSRHRLHPQHARRNNGRVAGHVGAVEIDGKQRKNANNGETVAASSAVSPFLTAQLTVLTQYIQCPSQFTAATCRYYSMSCERCRGMTRACSNAMPVCIHPTSDRLRRLVHARGRTFATASVQCSPIQRLRQALNRARL